jgi:hypothetical protein
MLVTVKLTIPAATVPTTPQSMLTLEAAFLRALRQETSMLDSTHQSAQESCADNKPDFVQTQKNIATQHIFKGASNACAGAAPERDIACYTRYALHATARYCSFEQNALTRHGPGICTGAPARMDLQILVINAASLNSGRVMLTRGGGGGHFVVLVGEALRRIRGGQPQRRHGLRISGKWRGISLCRRSTFMNIRGSSFSVSMLRTWS